MSKGQKRSNKETKKPKNDLAQSKKPAGPKYLREPAVGLVADIQSRPKKGRK